MARPRKPSKVKSLRGTLRSSRENGDGLELSGVNELPPPPDWLPNAHALKEWERLCVQLHALGILYEESLMTLGHLCALHGRLCQIWSTGLEPNASLVTQYRALVGEFGLTPVSAMKLTTNPEKKANPFLSNGRKHREHSRW